MILLYSTNIENNFLTITDDEHVHCVKVLRIKVGDKIFATDGHGNKYECEILSISKAETRCVIISTTSTPMPESKNCIAIAPTKNSSRIEWFVEKAVEIGVHEIIILTTQRTERKSVNMLRLEKIIISAMKQSLHTYLPKLSAYKDIESMYNVIGNNYDKKFIAWCNGPSDTLTHIDTSHTNNLLLIGPEGDFTNDEVSACLKYGFRSVALGDSRLRTETAGLVGLMMLRLSC
ncbi:MAG: RsmE family RNA methyltransferase [Saprospiraceae bacterium]